MRGEALVGGGLLTFFFLVTFLLVTRKSSERKKKGTSEPSPQPPRVDQAELFAALSHELRAPLTLILGPLQDLQNGTFGDLSPEAREEIRRIQVNSGRLMEIVDQFTDSARLDAGQFKILAIQEDLNAFTHFVADRFVSAAKRRGLDLVIDVPDDELWIYFDPEQMDKVLTNLLANAIKFTPTGGSVEIRVTANERTAKISVSDTGCGIAGEEIANIFDAFQQADNQQQARYQGSGLGLSIAQRLVELHHGNIEIHSMPGEGTALTVQLPRGKEHFRQDQLSETPDGFATWDATTVIASRQLVIDSLGEAAVESEPSMEHDQPLLLVIDDDVDLRSYLHRHLKSQYRVLEAVNGADGLQQARHNVPDLIVSDIVMAGSDGLELTREIRQDPELNDVPVILLTAQATAADRLRGLTDGADAYISKPFSVQELQTRISNILAQRQRLRDKLLATREETPPVEEKTPDFLEQVERTIDNCLAEAGFNADALAQRMAISRSVLYERLHAVTDKSPARLILDRRLKRGAKLLSEGASVAEVAYGVGFKSVSHFSQRFREHFGQTPSAYRQQA